MSVALSNRYSRSFDPNTTKKGLLLTLLLMCWSEIGIGQWSLVTNLSDSGPGSLRQEVLNSNSGDTLRFDSNLLSNGSDTLELFFPIIFTHGVTIQGVQTNQDTLYISGGDSTQLFYMDFVSTPGENMYFDDLVLIDAKQHSDDASNILLNGGALMARGLQRVEFDNVIFRDCRTSGEGKGGAAFFNQCDRVLLNNCKFERNETDDNATSNSGGWGGAIRLEFGGLEIKNSRFIKNQCSDRGGAIVTVAAALTIEDSEFIENRTGLLNTATRYLSGGAIVYTGDTTCVIKNSTFIGNRATDDGGAVVINGINNAPPYGLVEVSRCIFEDNRADQESGALSILKRDVRMKECTFARNRAAQKGGALKFLLCVGEIENSTFHGNASPQGSAAVIRRCLMTLENLTVTSGGASPRGVLISHDLFPEDTIKIKNSILQNVSGQPTFDTPNRWISQGYNIYSDAPPFADATDTINVDAASLQLEPLADNGGFGQTRLPGLLSPALNAGDPFDFSPAQNGPIFGRRDIGAADRSYVITDTALLCGSSYSWWGNTFTIVGTYFDTVQNATSIDSIGILFLTRQDTSIVNQNGVLISMEDNVNTTYQWVYCDSGYTSISGAIDSSFVPAINGSYAVILSNGSCSDTSSCYLYDEVGFVENDSPVLNFYPNPSEGRITIQSNGTLPASLMIQDLSGRLLYTVSIDSEQIQLPQLSDGVYILHWHWKEGFHSVDRIVLK